MYFRRDWRVLRQRDSYAIRFLLTEDPSEWVNCGKLVDVTKSSSDVEEIGLHAKEMKGILNC